MPLSLISAGRTEEWDEMIDVNVKGVLYGTNAVYKHFVDQGHGKIINISSVAGKRVMPGSAVYSGTKYAVRAFLKALELNPLELFRSRVYIQVHIKLNSPEV